MVLEKDVLLKKMDNDNDLFGEIIKLFLDSSKDQITEIRESINQKDSAELERVAHSLKGALSNFTDREDVDKLFKLEEMGRNQEIDNASKYFPSIEELISTINAKLHSYLD